VEVAWQNDYHAGVRSADERHTFLVVFFHAPEGGATATFESQVLAKPEVQRKLKEWVAVRVAVDAKVPLDGGDAVLHKHVSFAGLQGQPGLAVINLADTAPEVYGRVVGTLPLKAETLPSVADVIAFLEKSAAYRPGPAKPDLKLTWLDDYQKGMDVATQEKKMLLLHFCRAEKCTIEERFHGETLADPVILEKLQNVVRVRLPLDGKVKIEGQDIEVLKHAAFAEMLGQPGLAMVDLAHKDFYGQVVSVFPFLYNRPYTREEMRVILDLPPGTLTQRTLIYAVRTHPEHPASTEGTLNPSLLQEAQSHSEYQARILRQGHHFWETRFHRINALLGGGMMSKEVCAESWPGQGLLAAAVECVRCWRTSSGHWSAVSGRQSAYGFDMKRGSNGIWYATGIFGR
jgi:hypothetical protein